MAILAILNLYQSFWEKLSGKIWNDHFWPFRIYTCRFGKFLEWPFLAIPNLYQSFWEKLSEKIQNGHYWPFRIYTNLFGENCQEKFRTAIFGHSKFIPIFLGKIVRKKSEQPFLAILNLYQSFWEKLSGKIWNDHFWPFQIYTCHFGKILEWPFLAIPNLYLSFWENFGMAIFGHSKFIPIFLGKIQNGHYWPFRIYTNLFGENCQEKFKTAIFGHSKFIPVFFVEVRVGGDAGFSLCGGQ